MAELPPPPEGLVLTHFIVSDDVERSRRFYTDVLGGRVAFSGPGGPTYVALSNSWIIINVGGGPTDDKPTVTLETPRDPDRVSSFLNIRVKDIAGRVCRMERPWRGVPDAAEAARVRDPLLHPRSRRTPDRGRTDHGPGRGLDGPLAGHPSPRLPSDGFGHEHRDHRHWRARSVIARRLASGGESLRLSSADTESARMLAAAIGRAAVAAGDNRDALQGADAVVLALRFGVLKGVIDEIAGSLADTLVVVPSNPLGLDAHGNV